MEFVGSKMTSSGLHFAHLSSSRRLQRVLAVLRDGRPHTTREIVRRADVCAVNSIVSELRANGFAIDCTMKARGKFIYQMNNLFSQNRN